MSESNIVAQLHDTTQKVLCIKQLLELYNYITNLILLLRLL